MGRLIKYWLVRLKIYRRERRAIGRINSLPEKLTAECFAGNVYLGDISYRTITGKKVIDPRINEVSDRGDRFVFTDKCGDVQVTKYLPVGFKRL